MWDVHRARVHWPRLTPMPLAQVWLVRLPDDDQVVSAGTEACLSQEEIQRAHRFTQPRHAQRYIAAHAALRTLLAEALHCAAHELAWQTDADGKPHLPHHPLQFNLSHSDVWALVATHPTLALGVDLETHQPWQDMDGLALAIFHPDEASAWRQLPKATRARALHVAWTRKEACLKALGTGLRLAPEQVWVGMADAPRQGRWRQDGGRTVDWCDLILPLPTPHSACLAWVQP
ncbi:MAG: 4'-phosphopantetheinyl transferase superfamily protein [Aquabacterium commune]